MAGTGYTPTGGVFHGSIVVPVDGDPAVAASVNTQGLKFLADNIQWLHQNAFDTQYLWRVVPAPLYDADISINPSNSLGGHNVIDAVTLTADRTYEINDIGCVDGDWVFIINRTAHRINLNAFGGAPPLTTVMILGDWSFFIRSGGTWRQGASFIYFNGLSADTIGVGQTISGNAANFNIVVGATGTFNSVVTTNLKVNQASVTGGLSAPLLAATNMTVSNLLSGGKFFGLVEFAVDTPTDADHTLSVSGVTGSNVFLGMVVAPNVRAWSLPTANVGDWAFIRQNGTGRIDVKDDLGAALISLNNPTPANTCWVLCVFMPFAWTVMASGVNAV